MIQTVRVCLFYWVWVSLFHLPLWMGQRSLILVSLLHRSTWIFCCRFFLHTIRLIKRRYWRGFWKHGILLHGKIQLLMIHFENLCHVFGPLITYWKHEIYYFFWWWNETLRHTPHTHIYQREREREGGREGGRERGREKERERERAKVWKYTNILVWEGKYELHLKDFVSILYNNLKIILTLTVIPRPSYSTPSMVITASCKHIAWSTLTMTCLCTAGSKHVIRTFWNH